MCYYNTRKEVNTMWEAIKEVVYITAAVITSIAGIILIKDHLGNKK
jgi:hypothetical protein